MSTSLKYEPSSELIHIAAKQLFLHRELYTELYNSQLINFWIDFWRAPQRGFGGRPEAGPARPGRSKAAATASSRRWKSGTYL